MFRNAVALWFADMRLPEKYEDVNPDLLPKVVRRTVYDASRLTRNGDGGEAHGTIPWLIADHLAVVAAYDLSESIMTLMPQSLAARLADGSRAYGRIISNMLRPFGRRECKDHYLATYPDDRPVAFTVFDFDRHPPRGRKEPLSVESDEWLSIDEMFWQQVSTFHDLATSLDLDVMWLQSPGRWMVDGHHPPTRMFVLYAVIRHEPRTPSELRPALAALKDRIGLEVETSWDTRLRNIRIPGQCFMDVCRVDPSRRSIVPIRDASALGERGRNMARLAATVDAYGMLRPDGGERLLGLGAAREGVCARLIGNQRKGRPPKPVPKESLERDLFLSGPEGLFVRTSEGWQRVDWLVRDEEMKETVPKP